MSATIPSIAPVPVSAALPLQATAAVTASPSKPTEINVIMLTVFRACRPTELATSAQVCKVWNKVISTQKVWHLQVNFHDAFANEKPDIDAEQKKFLADSFKVQPNKLDWAGSTYYVTQFTYKSFPILHPTSQEAEFKTIQQVVTELKPIVVQARYEAMSQSMQLTQLNRQIADIDDRIWKLKEICDWRDSTSLIGITAVVSSTFSGLGRIGDEDFNLGSYLLIAIGAPLLLWKISDRLNRWNDHLIKEQKVLDAKKNILLQAKTSTENLHAAAVQKFNKTDSSLKKIFMGDVFQTRQSQ